MRNSAHDKQVRRIRYAGHTGGERKEREIGRKGRGKRERGQKKGSEIENDMSNTHQLKSATYDFQKLTTC